MRSADWIGAKLYLFFRAHVLNFLWLPREVRRENRRATLAASLPWYFKRNCMAGVRKLEDRIPDRTDEKDKIWSIWFQGEENAPELVKACFRSIRSHCREELVVIDSKTLRDYITLPETIMRKYESGKMKAAHFADICRLELLYEHGGYWIDSTCFLTAPVPDFIRREDFFVYMAEGQKYGSPYSFIQNCFIRARKGDYLLSAWRSMVLEYWMHHTGRMDYFQHQLMFKALVQNDRRAAGHFAIMPKLGQDPTHIIGCKYPIDEPYDKGKFEKDCSGAFFQKLTYRGADSAPEGSIIDYIKNYSIISRQSSSAVLSSPDAGSET